MLGAPLEGPNRLVPPLGLKLDVCEGQVRGVRRVLGVDLGISTTGVAGPDRQEGKPVGTVFVGMDGPAGASAMPLTLAGDRASIQQQTVDAAIGAAVSAAYGMVSRSTEEPGLG